MSNAECMIWTERGCWLQTIGVDGRIVSCFCGLLDTKEKVRAWCREQDLEFLDGEAVRSRRVMAESMAA